MRHKLVMVVLAISLPASILLATQTMASAQKSANGSSVNATGSVACSDAVGNLKLRPGWKTQSNNLPAPSKVIFNVSFNGCSPTGGNITTKVFSGHLSGSVAFPTNDCTSNFGAPVALSADGPHTRINWSKAARIGPVIPAATNLSLVSVTGTFTSGVGIKFKFSHQAVTGSFAGKTMSGELDSTLDACSPTNGVRNIPITAGNLAQP